jgi:peptidoglycan/LPS O-acetylase OafA/YrhL
MSESPANPSLAPGTPFRLGHRPALDGLRGLAILMVLLSHMPSLALNGGFYGVDLFFVLSGFLITSLLLEERRATGAISLRAFYVRRALRLLPALVVVLITVVALSAWKDSAAQAAAMRKTALITLLYSTNWFKAFDALPNEILSPAWSLSIEEQFYLLWPLLLVALLRLGASRRATAGVVIVLLLGSAAARAALWGPQDAAVHRIFFGTDTHADGLLCGVLAALFLSWGGAPASPRLGRALNWSALLFLGFLALFLQGWPFDRWLLQAGYLPMNLASAALVVCLVTEPWPPLRALFEFAPLVWIGRVSYGIYLWHIVVFWMLGRLGLGLGRGFWPVAVGATFALAGVSFYVLERPLLRLKGRFERVGSESSRAHPLGASS